MNRKIGLLLLILFIFSSCTHKDKILNKMERQSISVFDNKDDYKIAKAIKDDNTKLLKKLVNANKEVVIKKSFEDNYYSLLHFAVELQRTESVKILLQAGFNPDIKSKNGITPLFIATGFSHIPYLNNKPKIDIVRELIKYGANPELMCNEYGYKNNINSLTMTPLMNSISNSMNYIYNYMYLTGSRDTEIRNKHNLIDITKILVETGNVDINCKTELNVTAADLALYFQEIEKAYYLIVEKKADISHNFYLSEKNMNDDIPYNRLKLLRTMMYPLDSEEYKLKVQIVEKFKEQGFNYFEEPIPSEILGRIKKNYPDTWEMYADIY